MKRIVIKWVEKTSDGIRGIVILDCFKDNDLTLIPETFTCNCNVSKGSIGLSGIGLKGTIVPLTEEEIRQVTELMRWYLAGRNDEKETYSWFWEEGK